MAVTKERQPVYDWSTGDLISESRMDAMQSNIAYALQALQTYYFYTGTNTDQVNRNVDELVEINNNIVELNLTIDSECLVLCGWELLDLATSQTYRLGLRLIGSANVNRDMRTPFVTGSSLIGGYRNTQFAFRIASGTWAFRFTMRCSSNSGNDRRFGIGSLFLLRLFPTPTDGLTAFSNSGSIPLFSD